jgi:hypothetical protein
MKKRYICEPVFKKNVKKVFKLLVNAALDNFHFFAVGSFKGMEFMLDTQGLQSPASRTGTWGKDHFK